MNLNQIDRQFWIIADEKDRELLKSCGVIVGPYNKENYSFENCQISTFEKLDKYWGKFYWGPEDESKTN